MAASQYSNLERTPFTQTLQTVSSVTFDRRQNTERTILACVAVSGILIFSITCIFVFSVLFYISQQYS
uniref:Uncharacterized protein n=1 Tax=Parascaris equorum TaxID=6256 RepID=A0A914S3H3_PAREQ